MLKKVFATIFLVLFSATDALAIQEHGGAEGYFVHQIAHVIFIAAMVFMMVVLKKPTVARLSGWHSIRYAALFFLLWNVDAFLSHTAYHGLEPSSVQNGYIMLYDFEAKFYYAASLLEYVFLVPAFVFLAMGLNQLLRHLEKEGG